jgi:hypothetical protein
MASTRLPRPESTPPPPPKKGNPALLYGGIGGGALLIIVLIVVVSSGSDPATRPTTKPKRIEMPTAPSAPPRAVKPDTGAIVFVCANSGRHEDEEVLISACPCGAQKKFSVDREGGGYRCFRCGKIYDNAQIKCPKCGRVAVKTHLKPSFD